MHKLTSSTQLAAFLFVESWRHEPHDAVQCRAHGSTFEFLFEFQTEFFSNCLFKFQVVRASNRSTIEGPLYIHTYIPWIHKCVIKIVGCGTSHKCTYTNLQCKILQTFYKNVTNHLYTQKNLENKWNVCIGTFLRLL